MSSKRNFCSTLRPHNTGGFALCASLIFLTVLTMLGLSAMRSTTLGTKMVANHQFKQMSFQAAENALAQLTGEDPDVGVPTQSSNPVDNLNYYQSEGVPNQADTSADLSMAFVEQSPPGKYKFSGFGLSIVTMIYEANAVGKTGESKSRAHNRMQVALLRN